MEGNSTPASVTQVKTMPIKGKGKLLKVVGLSGLALFLAIFAVNLAVSGLGPVLRDQIVGRGLPGSNVVPQDTGGDAEVTRPDIAPSGAARDMKAVPEEQRQLFPSIPSIGDRIIKNGTITLRVKKKGFDDAFDRAHTLAAAHGGQVVASNVSTIDDVTAGTVTIRVPAKNFDKLMVGLRKLGKLREFNISSEDVTEQYVDLQSRLRSLRAQEAVLLSFMRKAKSIEETITIQQRLGEVQEQIEGVTGRINFLKNQSDLSTVQLTMSESPKSFPEPVSGWGTGAALERAAHAFVNTVNFTIVTLGYLAPWALIAYVVWYLARVLRREKPRTGNDQSGGGAQAA